MAPHVDEKNSAVIFRREPARQLFHLYPRHYPIDSMLAIPLATFLAGDRAFAVYPA